MVQTLNDIPLDWLVCPITKESLKYQRGCLHSSSGYYEKSEEFGFWSFMPRSSQIFEKSDWKIWQKLQENGMVSYTVDPEHNLGIGRRTDFLEFAKFCEFQGNVLDVGVGPQKSPTHIEHCSNPDVFFVGIDPLIGEQPRAFAFIQGLGEYLPFRAKLFDKVIFVTSLDHFIDPLIPINEAKRVLKKDGEICIWIGHKNKSAKKTTVSHDWYEKLEVPEGAEDPFHFKRFTHLYIDKLLVKAGLSISKKEINTVDKWRQNIFYRVTNSFDGA